jgi:hypothetical protein
VDGLEHANDSLKHHLFFQLGFWSKCEQNCTNVQPVMLHLPLVS